MCGSMPHHSWISTTPGSGSALSGRRSRPVRRLPFFWSSTVSLCKIAMLSLLFYRFEELGRGPAQGAFLVPAADLPPGYAVHGLRAGLDLGSGAVADGAD